MNSQTPEWVRAVILAVRLQPRKVVCVKHSRPFCETVEQLKDALYELKVPFNVRPPVVNIGFDQIVFLPHSSPVGSEVIVIEVQDDC